MRVAVIFPQKSLEREVMRTKNNLPDHYRLLDGASICANAARSIVTQSLQLADSSLRSTLLAAPPTYLAAVVLALGILQNPSSRLVRSDVELLSSATEFVESWYLHRGFDLAFTQACTHLRERVASIFQRCDGGISDPLKESTTVHGLDTNFGPQQQPESTRRGNHPAPSGGQVSQQDPQDIEASVTNQLSGDIFGNFGFEDLWNMTDLDFMIYDEIPTNMRV